MSGSGHRARAGIWLAAVAAVLAGGCSAGQDSGHPSARATLPADDAAVILAGDDPSAWTLPIQGYRPSDAQARTIGRAEKTLVERCMRGFDATWRPDPYVPEVGPKNLTDLRYGIHDANLSTTRGYQLALSQQARREAAGRTVEGTRQESVDTMIAIGGAKDLPPELLERASPAARSGVVGGKKVPDGGCLGQARTTLGTATRGVSPLVNDLTGRSYTESMEARPVKEVFARWSACMLAKGYTYQEPMDAPNDPRFGPDPKGVSVLETATARADLECRATYRVTRVWFTAESQIQQRDIRTHAAQLAADRRALDATLNTAADILAHP